MNSMNFNSATLTGDSVLHSERPRPSPVNLSAFAPPAPAAQPGANRMIGLLAAGAVQVVIIAALMFTTFAEKAAPPSEPLTVDIMPQEKVEPPPPPPMVKPVLAAPNIVMAAPPSFQIYEPPPVVATPPAPAPTAISTTSTPASGGTPGAAVQDFQIKLLRHLNRHKRYPGNARAKREQGVVYVRFSMDRRGNVLSAAIETSCKWEDLNAEGLALLTRAQPLPTPPVEVAGNTIEMIVPVEFSLRN
jgi:protein TonB